MFDTLRCFGHRLRRPMLVVLGSSLLLANLAAVPPTSPNPSAKPASTLVLKPLSATQLHTLTFMDPTSSHINTAMPLSPSATLAPRPAAVAAAPQDSGAANHRIGKAALVFGVLGTVGVVGGVIALRQSKTNAACLSGDASTTCSDVHKAAKIMIPASAVVAGLGYFFAFHHRF